MALMSLRRLRLSGRGVGRLRPFARLILGSVLPLRAGGGLRQGRGIILVLKV